jgi:hypothetical protein
VAIKRIPFADSTPEGGVPCNVIREISLLRELDHPNVVRFVNTFLDMRLVFDVLMYYFFIVFASNGIHLETQLYFNNIYQCSFIICLVGQVV